MLGNNYAINLFDLPHNLFYVEINEKTNQLLKKNILNKFGSYSEAFRYLGIKNSAYTWKKRRIYPLIILNQFINHNLINPNVIEQNLLSLRSGIYPARGKSTGNLSRGISPSFPIKLSPELIRIIAHLFGDGCLSIDKKKYIHLHYYNQSKELIESFKQDISMVFGIDELFEGINKTTPYVSAPAPVAKILFTLINNFNSRGIRVPSFIKNTSLELKSEFIRAFFDDEAHVCFKPPYRYIELALNNPNFIEDIKDLLREFSINTTKCYRKKFRNKFYIYYFYIRGYENIKLYSEHIGFNHTLKQNTLNQILESPGRQHYLHGETKNRILRLLQNKALSSKQISERLNRRRVTAVHFLCKLKKEGRVKNVRNGRHFVWEIK